MYSSSRYGAQVIWLAVHTTEGIMRAVDLRAWEAWPGSSHASNDETGVLLTPEDGFVPYERAAWTLRAGNSISENIEQCGWARWTRAEWLARPKLLDTTARWLADRSKARGIPIRRLTPQQIRNREPGILGHADYTYATGDGTHSDPGTGYPWDVVLAGARAYADPPEDDMASVPQSEWDDLKKKVDRLTEVLLDREFPRTGTVEGDTVQAARLRDLIRFADGNALLARRALEGQSAPPTE